MSLRTRIDSIVSTTEQMGHLCHEWLESRFIFNPTRPELRRDPHPYYKQLREEHPIHRSRLAGGWVLSRYRDVLDVLRDTRFSSDERNWSRFNRIRARSARAGIPDPYDVDRTSILRLDPPDHTRLRSLVSKAFTPRAIEAMRPRVESRVDELLSRVHDRGRFNLVSDFAAPLPVTVIAELIGVPAEDHERFRRWSDESIKLIGDSTMADRQAGAAALEALRGYFADVVSERRVEPRDDLISGLVALEQEGDHLSLSELLATLNLLMVAGNETTTKLIGNAVLALLDRPEQWRLLCEEPKRAEAAVDELLRFDGPVQLTSRLATRDVDFHGRRFRRGDQILLLLAAANRDPDAFEDPDRLDVTRDDVRHLALGHGLHFCLGAQLARLETGLALRELAARFPDLKRTGGSIEWSQNTILRGPVEVELTF